MLLTFLAIASVHCPVETARYVLRGEPDVTASFLAVDSGPEWPSNLALRIRFARTGHASWWLPWNGGSDGRQNLASTTDVLAKDWRPPSPDGGPRPLGNTEFIATDASYTVAHAVPRRGTEAPGHLLLPHLCEAVWYGGSPAHADRPDTQFFDLIGCRTVRP